jgi:hypothetical protein
MSDKKRKKVYDALIEGASEGLSDAALYAFVLKKCPKTTSKRIVRASLLALSDSDVRDANVLHVVYALAIKHRLDGGPEAAPDEVETDDPAEAAPQAKAPKPAKPSRSRKAAVAQNGSASV